jgi:cyclopropane fatty-acyl-phospholipid synthase-like methyltransferase
VDAIEPDADWFDGFFEGPWLDEIAVRSPAERTEQQVAFLLERLAAAPGHRLLDLACGHGRIALPFARAGWQVTGLDLSERSLALAREASAAEGLKIEWISGDMREPPQGPFDAVVNVFTAFGYFEDEAENQRVLDAVTAALAPGGLFLIDTINLLNLAQRWVERFWERTDTGTLFLQEHRFDALAGRSLARWTFVRDDGSREELLHSVRAYTPHELAVMLEGAGLEIAGAWGDFDGAELGFDSRRLILLGRKA